MTTLASTKKETQKKKEVKKKTKKVQYTCHTPDDWSWINSDDEIYGVKL